MGQHGLSLEFVADEFKCHDGTPTPPEFIPRLKFLHAALMTVRDAVEKRVGFCTEMVLVSGYRSPAHNKAVGGEPHSEHMEARAGDVKLTAVDPDIVAEVAMNLQERDVIHMGGVGRYDSFTHIDTRGHRARWDNRTKKSKAGFV